MNCPFTRLNFTRAAFLSLFVLLLVGCALQPTTLTDSFDAGAEHMQPASPLATESVTDLGGKKFEPYPSISVHNRFNRYPTSLDEFLTYTDLIVIAEIGESRHFELYGYDPETHKVAEPTEQEREFGPGRDTVDFTLHVEEVLWRDPAALENESVILRMSWSDIPDFTASIEEAGLKPFTLGDRYLFILTTNPDGTYTVQIDEHRLAVDEQGILYYSQMAPPYPVKHGVFTGGARYGGLPGSPVTVDALVSAANARASALRLAEMWALAATPISDNVEEPVVLCDDGWDRGRPYPTTLAGFLEYTDLIVTAELGDVRYFKHYGFDTETGERLAAREDSLAMDVADFTLHVEEVLWADETVPLDKPMHLHVLWFDEPGWEESMEAALQI